MTRAYGTAPALGDGHTPGPWSVYSDNRTVVRLNQGATDFLDDPDPMWIDANTEANAALHF